MNDHAPVITSDQSFSIAEDVVNGYAIDYEPLSSYTAATGFTMGTILWMLRSGLLLTSLMPASPAWRNLDPLPVLDRDEEGEDNEGGEPARMDRKRGSQDFKKLIFEEVVSDE